MYCNNNFSGKHWTIFGPKFSEPPGIRITEGPLSVHSYKYENSDLRFPSISLRSTAQRTTTRNAWFLNGKTGLQLIMSVDFVSFPVGIAPRVPQE